MKIIRVVAGAVVLSVLALSTRAVWSFTYLDPNGCNGDPVIWRPLNSVQIHQNLCSIPKFSAREAAYVHARDQWNDISNIIGSMHSNPVFDCEIESGDGQNEIAVVPASAIDGAGGKTFPIFGPCFIGQNDIDEMDVMVSSSLSFTIPSATSTTGTEGYGAFLHEMGHFFGFGHSPDHSVMRPTLALPYGGSPNPARLFMQDTWGVHNAYGITNRANLIPSAHDGIGAVVDLIEEGTPVVCTGQNTSVDFYLGNSGKVNSGTYNLRVRISTSPTSTGGTVVGNYTHSLPAFSEGVFPIPFEVPEQQPQGLYHIHVDMDHTSSITELWETDNRTISGKRLNVLSGPPFCP